MTTLRRQTPPARRSAAAKIDDLTETSRLALLADGTLTGFVVDPNDLERRFTVEILLDGVVVATAHADNFVPELAGLAASDGAFGFVASLPAAQLSAASRVEARLANLGTAVGHPIDLTSVEDGVDDPRPKARLRWHGGLRVSGWIDSPAEGALEIMVDGEAVAQVRAAIWSRIDDPSDPADGRNVRAFDVHLPERFADGRVHQLTMRKDSREPIPASTMFVAFPDGLAGTLERLGELPSERLRGELYDQIIPSSLPLASYTPWRDRFPLPAPAESQLQLSVIIVGQTGAERTIDSLEAQSYTHWTAGILEAPAPALDADAFEEFLDEVAADSDAIVALAAGALLAPNALARIAAALDQHPESVALYGDVDLVASDGQLWPMAFSAFDYERMLEQGYCAHLFALRTNAARVALVVRPDNLYRLFNASFDVPGPAAASVLHLPGSLGTVERFDVATASQHLASATRMHLETRGLPAKVTVSDGDLFPAVRVRREIERQRTTIVIPTRDQLTLLRTCLDSIAPAAARAHAEILVIDNDSSDPETLAYLAALPNRGIATLKVPGPFNFARLNNRAAATLDSDVLCLLNNDIEARDDGWLEEMLTRLAEPDVGAVGAVLTWPGGVVQHGGIVLGSNFAAAHAFTDRMADDGSYLDLLRVSHECSAVTAACLVTRRSDYLEVGGMDELRFPITYNDVDYCLRLREAGKRIVLTPHARLIHAESASRGKDRRADRRHRYERELDMLRARWGEHLIADPLYSPLLARNGVPYGALAWPPGDREPRLNEPPLARDVPSGI
ncbi:Glycosyl transferase, family 2 [Bradyrhizobium sp. ORS 375]|uniref:glycosyltransferase family 2 protein n=1 Tax=Bradyrhizobium sp. (strain ORS 375) TaxID=566679 RepID=UPI000240ACEF|nr:glycosyltransferase [Bradyrhizobium sp. ORS 375]CCD91747.1 Glycosyl transferase, family 2 [Bradyrhizobium sp. ORS 375]